MASWLWGDLLAQSFRNEPQQAYSELTPDAGRPFRRELFTDSSDIVQGNITLQLNDWIEFSTWYRENLKHGAIPFDFYDCRYSITRTGRFVGNFQVSENQGEFLISFKLNLDPINLQDTFVLLAQNGDTLLTQGGDRILGVRLLRV